MPEISHLLTQPLQKPEAIHNEFTLPAKTAEKIKSAREAIIQIMNNQDGRLVVIVGPCSIHDPIAALEYCELLKNAAEQYADDLFLVMRTYFEKPRTTIGWKGLISDPLLDNSYDVNLGLRIARKLLVDISQRGVFAATEFLDTIIPCYLSDLITWGAIGARTSASPLHRELASGLAMPIGFKNNLDGNFKIAIDAVQVASYSHPLLSITKEGTLAITQTTGNPNCHVILRGSDEGPNYHAEQVEKVIHALRQTNIRSSIMIDCSHGNSMKNYLRQAEVVQSIVQQIENGCGRIKGVMIESHLYSGQQTLKTGQPLKYGQSITDSCLAWEETLPLLEQLAKAVDRARKSLLSSSPLVQKNYNPFTH